MKIVVIVYAVSWLILLIVYIISLFENKKSKKKDYALERLLNKHKSTKDKILDKLNDLTNFFSLDLHFPYMIGCGLAGGDWNVMSEKIERLFGKSQTRAFIHKL